MRGKAGLHRRSTAGAVWRHAVAVTVTAGVAAVGLAFGPAAEATTTGSHAAAAIPREAPAGNAFYAPRSLPRGRPGDIIWTRPIAAPKGARAWKVLYHSQALDGRDIAVSGVIVTPTGGAPNGGRTIVSWAHGTRGIADSCAPSRRRTVVAEIPGIDDYLEAGYTVAATDYEGLGTPGVHPYLVGDSEARGILDIARAARRFKDAQAGDGDVIIAGHSQGGQGAVFAGEIAPDYAPDLHVLGVAALAPATELTTMLPVASTLPDTLGYVVMGLIGFRAAYPTADPTPVLADPVTKDLAVVEHTCADGVMKHFSTSPGRVIAQNPADVNPFPQLMQENTPGSVKMTVPMFVAQGDKDDTVLQPFTDTFVKRACAHGDTIEYRVYPGTDHYTVRDASRPNMLAWMADRVAGRAADSNC
ncbi:MAG TPA: alpha/beta fold hydrolase [Acidimicrobiia bacterium]|nr:alpha/beta fold hydrolase [Acidimicrobiia bacterium]